MKFVLFSLMANLPNAITGETWSSQQKFQNVINQAVLAEELGFDAYGVGERHGAPFLSSSPPLVLTAIAARTERIRLLTMVTVLSVLDPVRVAEDYGTLDHLSGGRLEIIIGKGNDPRHYPLFGITEEEQWDSLAERYRLLKRLWSEEEVTWEGSYRPPLHQVTTQPRYRISSRFPSGMAVLPVHDRPSWLRNTGSRYFPRILSTRRPSIKRSLIITGNGWLITGMIRLRL